MEQTREINATLTNEEIAQQDQQQGQQGKKVDKAEIVNMISKLPLKERLDLIRDLQNASAHDADQFSVGREGSTSHYDTLRDGYQTKAKEAEKKQQPKETK